MHGSVRSLRIKPLIMSSSCLIDSTIFYHLDQIIVASPSHGRVHFAFLSVAESFVPKIHFFPHLATSFLDSPSVLIFSAFDHKTKWDPAILCSTALCLSYSVHSQPPNYVPASP